MVKSRRKAYVVDLLFAGGDIHHHNEEKPEMHITEEEEVAGEKGDYVQGAARIIKSAFSDGKNR